MPATGAAKLAALAEIVQELSERLDDLMMAKGSRVGIQEEK